MTKRLVFVSTRFLFPVDSGGKIRTTQILRGMKGGNYEIVLLSPATPEERERHAADLETVCDRFESWPAPRRGKAFHYTRLRHLGSRLPIPVATDWNVSGADLIRRVLAEGADVVVFDFLHAAVLAPQNLDVPSVLFTHNVEAEIFSRHLSNAESPVMRLLWRNQHRKMLDFERESLCRFDVVVAVSVRDAEMFEKQCGLAGAYVIPTGVDLDFFRYQPSSRDNEVVFCGSMDWLPNQDAIDYFLDEAWPAIVREIPDACLTVVGRAPPARLVDKGARVGRCRFTGFVDDVRDHVPGAAVSIIPIRIGGGTRLKAYEALAMGTPVVSTSIGVEGLPLEPGEHYVRADTPDELARATMQLMRSPEQRLRIAENARRFVEESFSHQVAARAFEGACDLAIATRTSGSDRPDQPG